MTSASLECTSYSAKETGQIGQEIGKLARPGDVILLLGDLGAGKTTLTQGIARGLGVSEYTASPSFVLVREYQGRMPLYHIDLYRLEDTAQIDDLGLDEYFCGEGLSIVEWADRGFSLLPPEHLLIRIEYAGEAERKLHFKARGRRYESMLGQVRSECARPE